MKLYVPGWTLVVNRLNEMVKLYWDFSNKITSTVKSINACENDFIRVGTGINHFLLSIK